MAAAVLPFPLTECVRRFRVNQSVWRSRGVLDVIESNPAIADLDAVRNAEHLLLSALPIETAKQIKMNGATSVLTFKRSQRL